MKKYSTIMRGALMNTSKEKRELAQKVLFYLGYKSIEGQDYPDWYQFYQCLELTKEKFKFFDQNEKNLISEVLRRNDIDPCHLLFQIEVI